MKELRFFENDYTRFEDRGDIIYIWYKDRVFNLEMAKELVAERKKFTQGTPMKAIIFQSGLKGINRDARSYFSSDEAIEGVAAAAILAKNPFERHLANFFIGITVIRPKVPTKLFSDEQEALKWLHSI